MVEHGGSPDGIREICMDMSPAYRKGKRDHFPRAGLTSDRFHVVKMVNAAVDQVRREEQKGEPELKRTRYLWLKNRSDLRARETEQLERLMLEETPENRDGVPDEAGVPRVLDGAPGGPPTLPEGLVLLGAGSRSRFHDPAGGDIRSP